MTTSGTWMGLKRRKRLKAGPRKLSLRCDCGSHHLPVTVYLVSMDGCRRGLDYHGFMIDVYSFGHCLVN
jgi:hypothetical protein